MMSRKQKRRKLNFIRLTIVVGNVERHPEDEEVNAYHIWKTFEFVSTIKGLRKPVTYREEAILNFNLWMLPTTWFRQVAEDVLKAYRRSEVWE